MLSTAYLILLAPLAFAAPAEDPPQTCAPIGFPNPITADYDDLIVTELPPTEIGTYKWLKYDTFYVVSIILRQCTDLVSLCAEHRREPHRRSISAKPCAFV